MTSIIYGLGEVGTIGKEQGGMGGVLLHLLFPLREAIFSGIGPSGSKSGRFLIHMLAYFLIATGKRKKKKERKRRRRRETKE